MKKMNEESRCPECNYKLDAATCIPDKDAHPSSEDYTVCWNCGEIMAAFTDDMTLRRTDKTEVLNLEDQTVIQTLIHAQMVVRYRGRMY